MVLSLLSPSQGALTSLFSGWLWQLFGWGGVIIPIALGLTGFYLVLWGMDQPPGLPLMRLTGLFFLFLAFEAFATLIWLTLDNGLETVTAVAEAGLGGGYLGGFLVWLLTRGIGRLGAVFVLLVVGIVATIISTGLSRQEMGQFSANLIARVRSWVAARRRSTSREEIAQPANHRAVATRQNRPSSPVAQAEPAIRGLAEETATEEPPQPLPAAAGIRRRRRNQPAPAGQQQTAEAAPIILDQVPGQIWKLPEVDEILEPGGEQDISDTYIRGQVEIIEHTLESFGAPATVVEINQGPTITQYGVEPSFIEQRSGKRTKVKVGKIASLADDLTLALAARSIRIQAPVPGKGYVGIEVPNTEQLLVSLRDVMESTEFRRINSPLRMGLGQNVAGQPIAADLAQMPHLLIAGTTGSGKSVLVNSIVAGLLLQNTPETLKLVMVDPKRVELTGYNGIPHLVAPVVVDLERVVGTLQWAMREMDNRYKRLAEMGARNIVEHNNKASGNGQEKMPYIVIVIDELADLMMLSPEDTERGITRLAQLARATGIHMVIATQRPSVDVVTGLIKANFPARIAFAVASSTDSRVILDTTGAERLLGQGDMLFQSPDAAAPVRMQGCFVSERELDQLITYWQTARREARSRRMERIAESFDEGEEEAEPAPPSQPPLWEEMQELAKAEPDDELLPEAIDMVRGLGKASTSLLQRRFRIGYTRAARLMDVMEEQGIIGPPTGTSKAREVLPFEADSAPGQGEEPEEVRENEPEG